MYSKDDLLVPKQKNDDHTSSSVGGSNKTSGGGTSTGTKSVTGTGTGGSTGAGTSTQQGFNMTENVDKVGSYTAPTWNGGTGAGSQGNLEKLAQDYLNSDYNSFTQGADYESLAKRYSDQGRRAMEDTIGQMAARTGGIASAYATVAGQQAYGDWMGKLEDAARSLYDSQMAEKASKLGVAQGLYDRQYSEFQDNRDWGYQMHQDELDNAKYMDTAAYDQYQLDESTREKVLSDFSNDVYSTLYLAEDIDSMTYEQFKATYGGEIPEGFSETDFEMMKAQIENERVERINQLTATGGATISKETLDSRIAKFEEGEGTLSPDDLENFRLIKGYDYFIEKAKDAEEKDYESIFNEWNVSDQEGLFEWIDNNPGNGFAQYALKQLGQLSETSDNYTGEGGDWVSRHIGYAEDIYDRVDEYMPWNK